MGTRLHHSSSTCDNAMFLTAKHTLSPAQASARAAKEDAEVQTRLQRQEEALAAARAAAATAEGDAQVGFMKQS